MRKGKKEASPQIIVLRPSWLNYFRSFLAVIILVIIGMVCFASGDLAVLGAVLLLIAFIVLVKAILEKLRFRFTITADTVTSRKGVIGREEDEIRIIDIREVGVRQPALKRIFNVGDVFFASAATGGIEVKFKGVKDPVGIGNRVKDLRKALVAGDKKRCPQCGEYIWKEAKVCPHCRYAFEQNSENS